MKINVAKSAGFCFGVKRALDIAYKTAQLHSDIVMLGDIVHNEEVVHEITRAGIKKVKHLTPGKNRTLLIRAHGAPLRTFQEARGLGFRVIDATCPMVKEIHTIAQTAEQKGYTIIIIGDREHDEVRGIVGQLKKKAVLIENMADIPFKKIQRIKKGAVVVQSTQNVEKALKIVNILKQQIKNLRFFNTICAPTKQKQSEIKIMPLENDVMIIIGSKNSANTKRLYQLSKSLNSRSYWIQSRKDIKRSWFRNAHSVGITAGASTPDKTTQEVIECIKKLTS